MAATRLLRVWLAAVLSLMALVAPSAHPDQRPPVPARRAATGTIRGNVDFKVPPVERERRVNPAELGMSPRGAFDAREEPHARLDQRDESFVPHVLAIVAGTTVDFPNNDRTYHNVFSLSKTRSFDLGRYAAGHSKAILFDRPGIVRVFCDIHSHMSAFILVFAHRYFAVTDEEGRYHIDNVPPGSYNVVAWNEAMALDSRRAAIPESGGDIELSFLFEKR